MSNSQCLIAYKSNAGPDAYFRCWQKLELQDTMEGLSSLDDAYTWAISRDGYLEGNPGDTTKVVYCDAEWHVIVDYTMLMMGDEDQLVMLSQEHGLVLVAMTQGTAGCASFHKYENQHLSRSLPGRRINHGGKYGANSCCGFVTRFARAKPQNCVVGQRIMTINLKKALNLTVADALALPVFSQYVFEKDGKDVEETDSIYYSDEASGISLLTNSKGVVNAIFLDSGKDGENGAFDLAPLGLDFSHTREKIRARFGKPSRTRDPFYDDMLERSCGGWDAYDYEDHTLHFEYCPQDQTVNLVTYMTPNVTEIDDDLVFLFLPSLIATLVHHEDKKGAPLTREDVLSIRDKCKVEAVTPEVYQQVSQKRGYDDIDPENCWAEWLDYKEAND